MNKNDMISGEPMNKLADTMHPITLCLDHSNREAPLEMEQRVIEDIPGFCRVVECTVRNSQPQTFQGVMRLRLALPEEFTSPWIMVPGFLYGENRPAGMTNYVGKYPRYDAAQVTPSDMTSSWWDFAADRSSSPMVFCQQGENCFTLAGFPHYEILEGEVRAEDPEPQIGIGFAVGTSPERYLQVSIPACEEPFTYSNTIGQEGPTIRRLTLPPGAVIRCTLCLYRFAGDRHGYQRVLADYNARMAPHHPPAEPPELTALVADAFHGIVEAHYCPRGKYFAYTRAYDAVAQQIAVCNGQSLEWHQDMVGFVGGLLVCHALIQGTRVFPEEKARQTAIDAAEKFCREGISPSGLFWADYMPPEIETTTGMTPNPRAATRPTWGSGWLPHENCVHSRTIADACDHLAAMILRESETHPEADHLKLWKAALLGNVNAILDMQQAGGSYGQYYNALDGTIERLEGCGGLLWIPALLKTCRIAGIEPQLINRIHQSVQRAAAAYAPYIEAENIWGAPEDNDSPTSEDGMNAVMAYTDLYATFGDPEYLRLATIAADWMLTFRKTYNQKLPSDCIMGRYGMKSRGGDFASASNNHLHVFEVLCSRHLARLTEWTGNDYYLSRARDHWAFACQYLCRGDGMFNGFRGGCSEQFYWTNWGTWGGYTPPAYHVQKGSLAGFSQIWCIAVLALAAADASATLYPNPRGITAT